MGYLLPTEPPQAPPLISLGTLPPRVASLALSDWSPRLLMRPLPSNLPFSPPTVLRPLRRLAQPQLLSFPSNRDVTPWGHTCGGGTCVATTLVAAKLRCPLLSGQMGPEQDGRCWIRAIRQERCWDKAGDSTRTLLGPGRPVLVQGRGQSPLHPPGAQPSAHPAPEQILKGHKPQSCASSLAASEAPKRLKPNA